MNETDLPPPSVSILVVSFNTADLTSRCLTSVAEHCLTPHEVLVLDNASTDGSADLIAREHPDVVLIRSSINLGFARAVNLLASEARGEWLLLLNPDAYLVDDAVTKLLHFALSHPGHGTYGGRTIDAAGNTDPRSALGLPSLWSQFCFATLLSSVLAHTNAFNPESIGGWDRSTSREVGATTGCFMLVRRDLWKAVDGFDERYFVYGEDVDLALRLKAQGCTAIFDPRAVVVHEWGAASTSERRLNLILRGKVTLLRNHERGARQRLALALLTVGVAVRALIASRFRSTPWRSAWDDRSWRAGHLDVPAVDVGNSPTSGPSASPGSA